MKRNQAKILAKVVYDLVASAGKPTKMMANFIDYLNQRRLNHLLPSILKELEVLDHQKNNTVPVSLESRHEISKQLENQISEFLQKKLNKKVAINKNLNEDLLGGLVISYQDKMIDLSLRRQVNNLKKELIN